MNRGGRLLKMTVTLGSSRAKRWLNAQFHAVNTKTPVSGRARSWTYRWHGSVEPKERRVTAFEQPPGWFLTPQRRNFDLCPSGLQPLNGPSADSRTEGSAWSGEDRRDRPRGGFACADVDVRVFPRPVDHLLSQDGFCRPGCPVSLSPRGERRWPWRRAGSTLSGRGLWPCARRPHGNARTGGAAPPTRPVPPGPG